MTEQQTEHSQDGLPDSQTLRAAGLAFISIGFTAGMYVGWSRSPIVASLVGGLITAATGMASLLVAKRSTNIDLHVSRDDLKALFRAIPITCLASIVGCWIGISLRTGRFGPTYPVTAGEKPSHVSATLFADDLPAVYMAKLLVLERQLVARGVPDADARIVAQKMAKNYASHLSAGNPTMAADKVAAIREQLAKAKAILDCVSGLKSEAQTHGDKSRLAERYEARNEEFLAPFQMAAALDDQIRTAESELDRLSELWKRGDPTRGKPKLGRYGASASTEEEIVIAMNFDEQDRSTFEAAATSLSTICDSLRKLCEALPAMPPIDVTTRPAQPFSHIFRRSADMREKSSSLIYASHFTKMLQEPEEILKWREVNQGLDTLFQARVVMLRESLREVGAASGDVGDGIRLIRSSDAEVYREFNRLIEATVRLDKLIASDSGVLDSIDDDLNALFESDTEALILFLKNTPELPPPPKAVLSTQPKGEKQEQSRDAESPTRNDNGLFAPRASAPSNPDFRAADFVQSTERSAKARRHA